MQLDGGRRPVLRRPPTITFEDNDRFGGSTGCNAMGVIAGLLRFSVIYAGGRNDLR